MYTLISANDALRNDSDRENSFYAGECQDPSQLNQDLVKGNIIICTYSIRYVLGLSSIKQALVTAKNVSAAGIIFCVDFYAVGFQLNPTPMDIPGLIAPSPVETKVCSLLCLHHSSRYHKKLIDIQQWKHTSYQSVFLFFYKYVIEFRIAKCAFAVEIFLDLCMFIWKTSHFYHLKKMKHNII